MGNTEITFTKEEVKKMMIESFVKGENWGITYAGWFFPSEKEKADRAYKDCEEVYKKALLSKIQHYTQIFLQYILLTDKLNRMKKNYFTERKNNINILNRKILNIGTNIVSQLKLYHSLKKTNNDIIQETVIPALEDQIKYNLKRKEELEVNYMIANIIHEALPYITLKDRFKRFLKKIINK